jgi:hypothetical protein
LGYFFFSGSGTPIICGPKKKKTITHTFRSYIIVSIFKSSRWIGGSTNAQEKLVQNNRQDCRRDSDPHINQKLEVVKLLKSVYLLDFHHRSAFSFAAFEGQCFAQLG